MADTTRAFFELLQVALGHREQLSAPLSEEQWIEVLNMADKQTLIGILFPGVMKLQGEQKPSRRLLFSWYNATDKIREMNRMVNRQAVLVSTRIRQEGFRNFIVKGQAIAQQYPDPMLRCPGDIDVWMEGGRKKVVAYCLSKGAKQEVTHKHIHLPVLRKTEVEAHFALTFLHNPFYNRRLQSYYNKEYERQLHHFISLPEDAGSIPTPTVDFNCIFILGHLYEHLLGEGVGLRQVADYYFLLHSPELTETVRAQVVATLKHVGMARVAAAVMYVLVTCFGMERERCLVPPDEQSGKFLLQEILQGGNFGKYDKRVHNAWHNHALGRFLLSLNRGTRFLRHFPSEIICQPFFKIGLYAWRLKNNYV